MDKKFYLAAVDADIVAYRVSAACEEEPIEELYSSIDSYLKGMAYKLSAEKWCYCLTGTGNFREGVAETKPYKGNRKDIKRPKYLRVARQYLLDKYDAVMIDGYEADDLLVSLSDTYGHNCVIASIDKDLLQQQGWHYNFVKDELKLMTYDDATKFLWKQVITGDSTDNIPGLPKVGDKKAEAYLSQYLPCEYPEAVYNLYVEKGFEDIFREQYLLIKMKKDVDIEVVNVFNNFYDFGELPERIVNEDWEI